MAYISILTAICLSSITFSGFTDAAVSVDASFNDTRCDGGMVCPNDPLLFTCTVTGSINSLATVTLPSGDVVQINMDNTTVVVGGLPDGVTIYNHSAVVNNSVADYVLMLMIDSASLLNDGMIECSDATLTPLTDEAACPVANDPGPPQSLTQYVSANTVSSLVVEWQSPSLTGGSGISITSYTITVDDGLSGTVSDDEFSYNITGLVYNNDYSVEVAAVNECGFTSQPATLTANIMAKGPPKPTFISSVLSCNVPLNEDRPVEISWEYGEEIVGVLYPGTVMVVVALDPATDDDGCSNVNVPNASCTTTVTRKDTYNINLTLTNDFASTGPVFTEFNSIAMSVEENLDASVVISINSNCTNEDYQVSVEFGVQEGDDRQECMTETNIPDMTLAPGDSEEFLVQGIDLEAGERYCYIAHLISGGKPIEVIEGSGVTLMDITKPPPNAGAIAGGASAAVIIIIILIVVVAVLIYYCCCYDKNSNQKVSDQELEHIRPSSGAASPVTKDPSSAETGEAGPMYQDPNTISRSPHPSTGEVYTDVRLDKKKKAPIEHEVAPGGEVYAMPQKKAKKAKKAKKKEGEEEEELTDEEKAALYSVPDKKGQKAKSKGLNYADIDLQSSTKPAPPSQGSQYVEVKHN